MAETASWIEKLEEDDGLSQLISGLVFAERAQFGMLISETRRVAHAALEIIRKKVSEGRGEAIGLDVIDPYAGRSDPAPLPLEVLIDGVFKRLWDPAQAPGVWLSY